MHLNSSLQTGITVYEKLLIMRSAGPSRMAGVKRTVNGNCHAFGEGVAIRSNEGRDSAQGVDSQVILRDAIVRDGLDNLDVELVLFGYRSDRSRPRIALRQNYQLTGKK